MENDVPSAMGKRYPSPTSGTPSLCKSRVALHLTFQLTVQIKPFVCGKPHILILKIPFGFSK